MADDLSHIAAKVVELDKDVAIIKTELHGMHREIADIKGDVKASRAIGEETKDRVLAMESEARGAYRLLMVVQILVGIMVALGVVMTVRG
jgi:hypothetical protein